MCTCLIRGQRTRLFAEECEIGLVAIMLEQALECGADGAFVLFAESFVFLEFGVVGFEWVCAWV